jgi:hypothetical protein
MAKDNSNETPQCSNLTVSYFEASADGQETKASELVSQSNLASPHAIVCWARGCGSAGPGRAESDSTLGASRPPKWQAGSVIRGAGS